MGEGKGRAGGTLLRAFAAFFLYMLCNWLLTSKVFPIGTATAPQCRDIGTAVEALGFLAMTLAARRRPSLLRPRLMLAAPVALTLGGALLLACGTAHPVVVTVSVSLLELAAVFVVLSAGCALSSLGTAQVGPCVLAGLVLAYLARLPLADAAGLPMLALFALVQLGVVALARPDLLGTLEVLQRGETPEELALTNPFSFLPRTHRLFLSLLLFQTAYGVALSFGEVDNAPLATFAGIVPLAIGCVAGFALRRMPRLDTMFGWSLLLVMAGFLFAPLSQQGADALTSNLLEAGNSCFTLVFWSAMAVLARKNRTGALGLIAWSGFLLSAGVDVGASLGRAAYALMGGGAAASTAVVGAIALALAAYAVFAMRGFSFDGTVAALVESVGTASRAEGVPAEEEGPTWIAGEADMAETYGLTARESEIFVLLAQGRNGAYIQRQLGVSYNTVKTHVAHIYAKLGVHAHQELIDLVERADAV